MNTLATPAPVTVVGGARVDLYATIHEALRQAMSHSMGRVGSTDFDDEEQRRITLDGVDGLLGLLRGHLRHENEFVHAAIELRRPGAAGQTAADHEQHLESIANLEDESRALRHARSGQRTLLAARLYRHLALFIAENLEHMNFEETHNNATLWSLFSDAELIGMHERLVASIAPQEMAVVTRWMAAGLNDAELAAVFGNMQAKAPPPALDALLGIARTQLDDTRWARLCRALGRAPVPGLVRV